MVTCRAFFYENFNASQATSISHKADTQSDLPYFAVDVFRFRSFVYRKNSHYTNIYFYCLGSSEIKHVLDVKKYARKTRKKLD